MTEGTGDPVRERTMQLHEWSDLPLHRLVVTAALGPSGALLPVDQVSKKAERASIGPGVVAFAAHAQQIKDVPWPDNTPGKPAVLEGADTLPSLAAVVAARLSHRAYGPVVPLPAVLLQAGSGRVGPWPRAYDYRAGSYRALDWLDERVLQALQAPAHPSGDQTDPPEGVLRKYANRGYIHILATASGGKTSWALNWVRQSTGEVAPGALPPLAGWYFARRQGQGADVHGSEMHALQNLISLARRQRDVLPRAAGPADPAGTPLELLSKDEADAYHAQPDANHQQRLSQRFLQALKELVEESPPSAEQPLVFLIDGGDEMWGPGTKFQRWSFPHVLPTMADLPEHVYVVLLSRPGPHMLGFTGKVPLLRYAFTREDVDRSIRQYLLDLADAWAYKLPGSETAVLLRQRPLHDNICKASEGAFGYVALLMREWLPRWDDEAHAGSIEHDVRTLRRWCERPEALPEGIYGLRADEFLALQEQEGQPGAQVSLAEALALVGQLRWPLSRHQLLELLYPGNALFGQAPPLCNDLRAQLVRGSVWLVDTGTDDEHEPLRFGHLVLQETALAAWRLQVLKRRLDRKTLAREARAVAEGDNGDHEDMAAEALARRMALAQLHAMLAGALKHEREPEWSGCGGAKRPALGLDSRPDVAAAYDWVWGPLHAIQAAVLAAKRPERVGDPPWMNRGSQARAMLINAPYLQSIVRAQAAYAREHGAAPDALALREAYILADRLPCEDPEQTLRHRVEAALLQWHQRIAEETLQVGGMLWNLLGADEQGKAHAQRWKDSIDRPALITTLPGRPSDLARQIPATSSAVTPCGNWLVTSDGQSKTEVWDLRDGWHRALVHLTLPWALGAKFEAIAVGQEIGIGGVDPLNDHNLFMAVVHLKQGTGALARYAGHRDWINAVSLHCREQGGQTVWAVASGSVDGTVGLLLRTGPQIEDDAQRAGIEEEAPNPGLLARYAGHWIGINAVSLHCREQGGQTVWGVASTSFDKTVGLLLRTGPQIEDDAKRLGSEEEAPIPGLLARYAGHRDRINAVSLHCREQGGQTVWGVASGSDDNTVGLLLRTGPQIEDDAQRSGSEERAPIPGLLARYMGHRGRINAVSLHCREQGGQTVWAVASGSDDNTVGLLLRTGRQIEDDAQRSGSEERAPIPGLLARYAGHWDVIEAVSLHCREQGGQTVWAVASGSDDETVGLLLRTGLQIEDDAQRSGIEERGPNPGLLARYAGHRNGINAVSLHCREQGGQTVWAVASGSDNYTVGLLLRTGQQIEDDAKRSDIEKRAPIPGLLARYAGHRSLINAVSLHCREQGGQTVWGVASGSVDGTVGLLLRTGRQIKKDAQRSGSEERAPIPGLLARYAGHRSAIYAVSLHCREQGGQTVWAVASGSGDNTVGLLLRTGRQIKKDAQRSDIEKRAPIPGLLARYAGHRNFITAVSLHCREQGGQTVWAVASGTDEFSRYVDVSPVGLLLRTGPQIEDDAQRSGSEERAPIPGLLARYTGHRGGIRAVSLHCREQGGQTVWAVASGSDDNTVGLLLRTGPQIEDDAQRSGSEERAPIPGLLARYAGHRNWIDAVSLHCREQGGQTVWAVASGSNDNTVGLLLRTGLQIVDDAQRSGSEEEANPGLLANAATGLPGSVHLRAAVSPPSLQPVAPDDTVRWFGGNATAAMVWSCNLTAPSPALCTILVCPLGHLPGFNAMDFAQAPDRIHYAIAGAVANDVAILPLEIYTPLIDLESPAK